MPQLEEEALVLDAHHHHPKSRSHGSGNRRVAPASSGGSPEPTAAAAAVDKTLGSDHWRDGDQFAGEISGFWDKCSAVFTAATGGERRRSVDGAAGRGICIWESDGESGDITCEIIGTVEASSKKLRRDFKSFNEAALRPTPCCLKKPGEMISKGHKKYDLMLNLQLGISYSVGKPAFTQTRDLLPRDFDPREKFWTRFPPEGSKLTPSHASIEFRWKDYCPMVFRYLRKLFSVDSADYMLAICGNDALRELSSPGKSGSFFYLTQDDRFMIKTVKKSEVKVLIRMLPNYYQHMCQYNNSLVTKFFGVHCIKPVGGPKVRFIVMGNLFCSESQIHRRFDLKGSSYGRITDKPEGEIDETTTFKDLDLNFVFRLQKSWFEELIKQIDRDCKFLEGERIMDYSLLLGVHFCDDVSASKIGLSPCVTSPNVYRKWDSFQDAGWMSECRLSEVGWHDTDQILDVRNSVIQLGSKMPSRAEHIGTGEVYDAVLYFGVIDVLQDYDISKKLEHAYKSLQVDPTSISAVDPKLYSRRFRDFIREIFTEDR